MRLYSLSRVAMLCGVLAAFTSFAHADTQPPASPAKPKELPSKLGDETSVAGTDYRLHPFIAKDAVGHPLTDVPANIVDVFSGAGDWDAPKYNGSLAMTYAIPADIRDRIQLFYVSSLGWIVVPKGWVIHSAGVGADGSADYEFAPPPATGEVGWLEIDSAGGCVGCMYSLADGLVPAAHAKLEEMMDDGTPEPTLDPKPESMTHPTPCMAVLRYRTKPSLTVNAVVFLGHTEEMSETDEEGASLYIALPDASAKLAAFITGFFQKTYADCAGVD